MQNNSKKEFDLKKRSFEYGLETIKFVERLDKKSIASWVIRKQLLRSATSIGANIVEAQAGRTRKDFENYLNHALKSAKETQYWLFLLKYSGNADMIKTEILINEAIELAKILAKSILTLKGKRKF